GTGGGGGGGGGWDGAVGGGGQSGFADQQTGNNAGGGGAAGKSAVTSASFAKTAAQLPTHLRGSLPSDQSRTSGRRDGEVVITFIGYEYEVYFNDDGGIDGAQTQYPQISPYSFCVHLPTTSSDDYNPHLPATVKAPTKAGYLFEGYFDATNFAGTPFYTFNGTDAQLVTDWLNWNYWDTPVELKAKWTPVDYTVVYESTLHNSGAVPADPNTYTFDGTEPLVLDNTGLLVRNGYAFGGWTPDGETTVYQSGNTLDVNSHPSYIIFDGTDYTVTLTAVWTKVYTVTYEGGEADTGGTPPVDDTQYLRGQKVTVLDNIDYIKSGNWAFGGWSPDGGTTIYQAGQTFPMPDHDVILIAQWVKLYTVTYADGGADGGGVLPVADALFYPGQTVNVYGNSGTLKKTGSRFGGWISNYDAKIYQEGQWFPMPGQDVILTAKWIDEYTVTYVGDGTEDGGNAPEDVYSPYIANETVTVLANIGDNPPSIPPVNPLVKNGYILVGWNDGTNDWIPGQTFPMPAASVTLTARWALACTVTYAANGGSGSVPVDGFNPYAQGAAVKVMSNTLSAPVPGQVFGGWLNSQDSKIYKAGEYFDIGNVDVTLTAQWTTKPFVPVFKYLQDTESVGVEMNLAIIEGWDAELTKFSVNGQIIPGPAYTPITKGTYLIEAFSTTNPTVKIWKYVTVN
ncbi:MAG: InlB B-repeat-containing protein, partial [Bacteroidetes bacterium]|nr:InlB B-repeat-containing protein [Bacteroidota bacterium]